MAAVVACDPLAGQRHRVRGREALPCIPAQHSATTSRHSYSSYLALSFRAHPPSFRALLRPAAAVAPRLDPPTPDALCPAAHCSLSRPLLLPWPSRARQVDPSSFCKPHAVWEHARPLPPALTGRQHPPERPFGLPLHLQVCCDRATRNVVASILQPSYADPLQSGPSVNPSCLCWPALPYIDSMYVHVKQALSSGLTTDSLSFVPFAPDSRCFLS